MFLYHATGKSNVDSIMKHGLLTNPPKHSWKDFGWLDGHIFLAFDANIANDYRECCDEDEEIVVLKIQYEGLNPKSFGYDWNNRCFPFNHIQSAFTQELSHSLSVSS